MDVPRKNRRTWLGIAFSLFCLLIIFYFINPREIWEAIRTVDLRWLSLTALGILLFMLLRAVRWQFMLGEGIGYRQVFHVQNIGYMLNMYLPARLGDVARAILIGSIPPITISQGISTMVVERILDLMFMVTLLPLTLASVSTLPADFRRAALAAGIIAVIAIVILIVAANRRDFVRRFAAAVISRVKRAAARPAARRWRPALLGRLLHSVAHLDVDTWVRRVDDLLKGLDSLTRPKDGLILVALSILVWLPILLAYQFGMRAVGLDMTLPMATFVVCAAALSIAAPSSPGGLGVFQAGVIAALQVLGQPEAASASFAFVYHITNYVVLTILGIIGLLATGATMRTVLNTTQDYLKKGQTA